jgi:hypothetical protein
MDTWRGIFKIFEFQGYNRRTLVWETKRALAWQLATIHKHSPGNNTRALMWGPSQALVDLLLIVGFCLRVPLATQKPLDK